MSWAGALRNEPLELTVMPGIIPTLAWPAHPDGSAELLNLALAALDAAASSAPAFFDPQSLA